MSDMKKYKISPISFYRRVWRRTLIQDYRRVGVLTAALVFLVLSTASSAVASTDCNRLLATATLHPTLTKDEITLTPLTRAHRKSLYQLFATEDVNRFFLGFASPEKATPEHLQRAQKSLKSTRRNYDGLWIIQYKNQIAGFIMLTKITPGRLSPEHESQFPSDNLTDLDLAVGYALDPKFRGHGIATRALDLATEFAKEMLEARYVFASANKLNEPSTKVLLRAGYEIFPHPSEKQNKFYKRLN